MLGNEPQKQKLLWQQPWFLPWHIW